MNPFSVWTRLKSLGLLGLNERNAGYTLRCNPREFYPRVDNKLITKRLCADAGIPTASILGVAEVQAQVGPLIEQLGREPAFALKPAHGAMGNGILVIVERDGAQFRRAGGDCLDAEALRFHASSIVSGLYALAGHADVAFAEECLEVHPAFREIATDGVPDLRFVVYRGVPVMGMTRLPTRSSRGRANLHQGAVGAGIDLATGCTTHAVLASRPCALHPDTRLPVVGRLLPEFDRALEIAVRAADTTGLGYVGADVVVDAKRGALILELNARPGLAVQVANHAGLKPRLRLVDEAKAWELPLERRIDLGRELAHANRQRVVC